MNIEELRLIIEAIGKLGDAGQTAFGWWLLADKVLPSLAWIACLSMVAFTAYKIVIRCTANDHAEKLSLLQQAHEAVRRAWIYGNHEHKRDTSLYEVTKALESMVEADEN